MKGIDLHLHFNDNDKGDFRSTNIGATFQLPAGQVVESQQAI